MKCMCLQAMTIVYFRCHEEIGAFNDTRYIVGMLERVGIIRVLFFYTSKFAVLTLNVKHGAFLQGGAT